MKHKMVRLVIFMALMAILMILLVVSIFVTIGNPALMFFILAISVVCVVDSICDISDDP